METLQHGQECMLKRKIRLWKRCMFTPNQSFLFARFISSLGFDHMFLLFCYFDLGISGGVKLSDKQSY